MNEDIRKPFLNLLDRLNENVDYEERITKPDTKFSFHTLAAFLSYYALIPPGLSGWSKEYLLNGKELFSLLNSSSSIGVEEIWNLIDIVNTNSTIKTGMIASQHNEDKYLIPSFSTDTYSVCASFEEYGWDKVGELLENLNQNCEKKISSFEGKAVPMKTIFEDIHKMLNLFKITIDQTHIDTAAFKTKHPNISFLLKRLSNALGLESVNLNDILNQVSKDKNKIFEERKDSSAESDNYSDHLEPNNSLSFKVTKCKGEQRSLSKNEVKDKEVNYDEGSSSKSDNDSENLENYGATLDKQEYDSESEEPNSENEIDYFEDMPGDVSNVKYKDFYKDLEDDLAKHKDIKFMNDVKEMGGKNSSEEEEEEEGVFLEPYNEKESKSSFELKEEKKRKKITKLEEDLLKSKPWTLQGEVDATQRPLNSLLEEVVEVDLSQRPPPVITRKRTKKLHNIISEIIYNKSFDDVQKKQRPVGDVNEFKNKIVLNQEKSKFSLAEIYEKEYLKEIETKNTEDKKETEPAEKKEIRELMHSVITKLQVLSNLHFIPKPALPELRVVSNMPAVAVEEVAPVATSHDKLLAPEEISGTSKRLAIDKEERTVTDKKRERRKKKLAQKHRAKLGRGNFATTGNKRNKNTEELSQINDVKQLKSSKTFFDHLQQKQEMNIKLSKDSKNQNSIKGNSFILKKNKKRKPEGKSGRIEPKKIKL